MADKKMESSIDQVMNKTHPVQDGSQVVEKPEKDNSSQNHPLLIQYFMAGDTADDGVKGTTKKVLLILIAVLLIIIFSMLVFLILYLFVFKTSPSDAAIQASSDEFFGGLEGGFSYEGTQNISCSSIGWTNCSQFSTCIVPSDDNSTVVACRCMEHYRDDSMQYGLTDGSVCTEQCSSNIADCENGGSCMEIPGKDTVCSCRFGFDGSYCELIKDPPFQAINSSTSTDILQSVKYLPDNKETFKPKSWSKVIDDNNQVYQIWQDSKDVVGYPHFTLDLKKRYYSLTILLEWAVLPFWNREIKQIPVTMVVGEHFQPCYDNFTDETINCTLHEDEETQNVAAENKFGREQVRVALFTCQRGGTNLELLPRKFQGFQHIRVAKTLVSRSSTIAFYRFRIIKVLEYQPVLPGQDDPLNPRQVIFGGMDSFDFDWDTGALFAMTSPAEPVAWNPATRIPFIVASQIGKGRLIVQSSGNFAYYLASEEATRTGVFKKCLRWLRGLSADSKEELEAEFLSEQSIENVLKYNLSSLFYTRDSRVRLTADVMKKLVTLIREGRVGLFLSTRGEEGSDWEPLLRSAGIFTPRKVTMINSIGNPVDPKTVFLNNPVPTVDEFMELVRRGDDLAFLEGGSHAFLALDFLVEAMQGDQENDLVSETFLKWQSFIQSNMIKFNSRLRNLIPLPGSKCPATTVEEKSAVYVYNRYLLLSHFKEQFSPVVDNTSSEFIDLSLPEDFPPKTNLKERKSVTVTLTVVTRFAHEIHSTGWYLAKGGKVSVSDVKISGETASPQEWKLGIGCWTYDLSPSTNKWERIPEAARKYTVHPFRRILPIYSSLGGTILLENEYIGGVFAGFAGQILTITLTGDLIEAPFFDSFDSQNSIKEWDQMKNLPDSEKQFLAPWSEVRGRKLSFCLPTDRSLTISGSNVNFMQTFWDDTYHSNFALLDLDFNDPKLATPQRLVLDPQPAFGYGQSGYPIIAQNDLNWFQYALDRDEVFKRGSWGLSHEIGHNLEKYILAWPPMGELHNNLFSLWNRVNATKLPLIDGKGNELSNDYIETSIKDYLGSDKEFNPLVEWKKDVFIGLSLYAQLANHFGWGLFSQVFRSYHNEYSVNPSSSLRNRVSENVTVWVTQLSRAARMNLVPLFRLWHVQFPIDSRKLHEDLQDNQNLPCFLPKDNMSVFISPVRMQRVMNELGITDKTCISTPISDSQERVPFPYPKLG